MKLGFFKTPMIDAADSYMSRLSQRQQIISSNLANLETPGYKAKDVSFNATMQELLGDQELALGKSDSAHQGNTIRPRNEAQVFEVDGLTARADNNNVDLDKEMVKLGDTSFRYNLMLEIVKSKIKTLQSTVKDA
jgi:flagellar basal-body rod protein FlgB